MKSINLKEFYKNIIKIENIEHKLYQITQKGYFYLKDVKFIRFINIDEISFEKYYKILQKYGITADKENYLHKWNVIIQMQIFSDDLEYVLTKYSSSWSLKSIPNLKKSLNSNNCGWELLLLENLEMYDWVYKILKDSNIRNSDIYSISVDSLKSPTKIFIYDDKSKNILTINYKC